MKSLQQILHLVAERPNQQWTLATLVATRGSTYRQPGARLLIAPDGTYTGVLSGGCLEDDVAERGLVVLETGTPLLMHVDTRRLFGCDGHLEIFIEPVPCGGTDGNFLTTVAHRLRRRQLCRIRIPYGDPSGRSELIDPKALIGEQSGVFTQTLELPIRLLLFGSGPEIPPLRWFAAGLGWVVQEYRHPDELEDDLVPDRQTAAVVMTHQFGRDLTCLDRLLPHRLRYLGLLGPKRRHAELLARLQDYRDLDPTWLAPLHAPAGLDIGSESPEEIALSITSEIAAVLAEREGGFLTRRLEPIHQEETRDRKAWPAS